MGPGVCEPSGLRFPRSSAVVAETSTVTSWLERHAVANSTGALSPLGFGMGFMSMDMEVI